MGDVGLTPQEMESALLYYGRGVDQPQIAVWLNLPLETVKKRLQRAAAKQPNIRALRPRNEHRPRVRLASELSPAINSDQAGMNLDNI